MADDTVPARQTCDICGTPKIITRRITRTTQVCPHTAHQSHRDERWRRNQQRKLEVIEQYCNHAPR